MKVFYKKDYQTNIIKEIVLQHTKVGNHRVQVVIFKSTTEDDSTPKELLRKEYSTIEYLTIFRAFVAKLLDNGWKESYEETLESKYSTFIDGKNMPAKVTKYIDPFESVEDLMNLTLPMYLFSKPNGYQDVYFDGKFRDNKVIVTNLLMAKANYVFKVLGAPFHAFVYGNELIVYDVAIPNYPYSTRLNILTELEGKIDYIKPHKYEFKELLFKDYKVFSKISKEIYMFYSEHIYVPGISLHNAYIVGAGVFNEALILDIEGDQALCVDYEFNSLFEVNAEDKNVMDIINYRENETVTISI